MFVSTSCTEIESDLLEKLCLTFNWTVLFDSFVGETGNITPSAHAQLNPWETSSVRLYGKHS